jgi:uncharacterized membrane protein
MRGAVLALAVAWPLSLHLAVLFGQPDWPARVNAAALMLAALAGGRPVIFAAVAATAATALAWAPQILVLAPPVVINAGVAWFFGSSLLPGREPRVIAIARREQGGALAPELQRHALVVTWLWTLLPAALALASLALALWSSLEAWSLFANCVVYILLISLFVGEYVYRRLRYPGYGKASVADFLRHLQSARLQ